MLSLIDNNQRFLMIENSTVHGLLTRYIHPNHQGSCTLETDDNGDVITYEEYHPFGTTSYQATTTAISIAYKRYRYTGMERDDETGLNYHNARYYITWLGRWLSPDPIGIGDGVNVYSYCWNNPVNHTDFSGFQIDKDAKKGQDHTQVYKQLRGKQKNNGSESLADKIARGIQDGTADFILFFAKDMWKGETYSEMFKNFLVAETTGDPNWTAFLDLGMGDARERKDAMENFQWDAYSTTRFVTNIGLSLVVPEMVLSRLKGMSNMNRLENSIKTSKRVFNPGLLTEVPSDVPGGISLYYYDNVQVGLSQQYGTGFRLELNLPQAYQNMGIGPEIFKRAVADHGGGDFVAMWQKSERYATGASVNLERYKAFRAQGLSKEEAAWSTWSGKQAKQNGYDVVIVTELENGNVEALFSRTGY